MAAWNSLGGMKAPAEDEDGGLPINHHEIAANATKLVEPAELDILSAFWVAIGGDPLAAEASEGNAAPEAQVRPPEVVTPAAVNSADTSQAGPQTTEPTQRITVTLPTALPAQSLADGTLLTPAAVDHLTKTAQSLRSQVRKEVASKRKVLIKLQNIVDPSFSDFRLPSVLGDNAAVPPTPGDARPEGAGAMPTMQNDTHSDRLTAAVAALSQHNDIHWLEKLHDLERSTIASDVLQSAPQHVSSSLKALSCTSSLLQLAEAEDRAMEQLMERLTQGFLNDKTSVATAKQELLQKQQTLQKMESQTIAQLKAAEERSAEILREIDVKLDVLASEQAAFKVQQTNIVAMGSRATGDASPGVESSRQASEAAGLLAHRKALELSRLRSETLGVQPWTLALSLRRWHQPNSSTYERKLLLTEWLVAIQEWHANNVSSDAVLSVSTVPAFVGVNRIRSAMHAAIDLLIGDLRFMAGHQVNKTPASGGQQAPGAVVDEVAAFMLTAATAFTSSSEVYAAVTAACSKVPYALFALERRVRLVLLRVQVYDALCDVVKEGNASREQIIDAHLQAGSFPIMPLDAGTPVELSIGLGVEPAPTMNVVAMAAESNLRRSIAAFPFLMAALRELFPISIIPDEAARTASAKELEIALRNAQFVDSDTPHSADRTPRSSRAKFAKVLQPPIAAVNADSLQTERTALLECDRTRCHGRLDVARQGKETATDSQLAAIAQSLLVGLDMRVRVLLTSWSLEHLRPSVVYSVVRMQGCILAMGSGPNGNTRTVGDVTILLRATQAGLAKSAGECGYRVQLTNDPAKESLPVIAIEGNRSIDDDSTNALSKDVRKQLLNASTARCQLLLRRDVPVDTGAVSGVGSTVAEINAFGMKSSVLQPPAWDKLFAAPYAPFVGSTDASALWRRRGPIDTSGKELPQPSVNVPPVARPLHVLDEGMAANIADTLEEEVISQERAIKRVIDDVPFFPKDVVRLTYRLLLTAPWVDGVPPSRDYTSTFSLDSSSGPTTAATSASAALKPTHSLLQGQCTDLARCVLGPECHVLHDPAALVAIQSRYEQAKSVAVIDAIGGTNVDPALVQSIRQYFGEHIATVVTMFLRMRRDMTLLLVAMVLIRFVVLEVIRSATGREAEPQAYRLLQYMYAIFVISIMTTLWEQAWLRKKALHDFVWGILRPSPEKLASSIAAATAASAAYAANDHAGGNHVKQSAGASMAGGQDEAPEDDELIEAGRFFKPWYSSGDKIIHFLTLMAIFVVQGAAFCAVAYFAWWSHDQRFAVDSPVGIVPASIFCSLSGVVIWSGNAVFWAIRSCETRSSIRRVGTGALKDNAEGQPLPMGKGVDNCRKIYTRKDELHDFVRSFVIKTLPHFTTVLYLAVVDRPATGGKLSFENDPMLAAAYQLLGLNLLQFLSDAFVTLFCGSCRPRSRAGCGSLIRFALLTPISRSTSAGRIPWYTYFQQWAVVREGTTCSASVTPSFVEQGVRTGEPFSGVDFKGPWGTPPLSGKWGSMRLALTLKRLFSGVYDAALFVPFKSMRRTPSAAGKMFKMESAAEASKRATGPLGATVAGYTELAAEKLVEARSAVGVAVQSRAAIYQVYNSWLCLSPPLSPADGSSVASPTGSLKGGAKKAISFAEDPTMESKVEALPPIQLTAKRSGLVFAPLAAEVHPEDTPHDDDSDATEHDAAYLLPKRDLPNPKSIVSFVAVPNPAGAEDEMKDLAALVEPTTYPLTFFSSMSKSPLWQLPHYYEADQYALMLFIFGNAVAGVILQPWYVLMAVPLAFHFMDAYVDTLIGFSKRRYPSRILSDFWTRGTQLVVLLSILTSVVIIARNPMTSIISVTWTESAFNPSEFVLAVLGVSGLWVLVRSLLSAALSRNMVANGVCCGRKRHEFEQLKAYMGYVEDALFMKANRMHMDLLRSLQHVGGPLFAKEQSQTTYDIISKRLKGITTDLLLPDAKAEKPTTAAATPAKPKGLKPRPAAAKVAGNNIAKSQK